MGEKERDSGNREKQRRILNENGEKGKIGKNMTYFPSVRHFF